MNLHAIAGSLPYPSAALFNQRKYDDLWDLIADHQDDEDDVEVTANVRDVWREGDAILALVEMNATGDMLVADITVNYDTTNSTHTERLIRAAKALDPLPWDDWYLNSDYLLEHRDPLATIDLLLS
jgi:hypothetical protein